MKIAIPGKWKQTLADHRFIFIVYLVIVVVASILKYFGPLKVADGVTYTQINNYIIFKQSFFHLIQDKDLYKLYPQEHWDLYKYSPAFALFMGLFAWLPDVVGVTFWNLLNALGLFFALSSLKLLTKSSRALALWFVLPELIISIQNGQSNGLMAALIIGAFNFLEKRQLWIGTLLIVASVFIKLFGFVAFLLCLFYPQRWKSVLYSAFWFMILLLIPLLVTSWQKLLMQYQSWLFMLQNDTATALNLSVMNWLESWFGILPSKSVTVVIGGILLLLPLIKISSYQKPFFRLLYLAAILVWVVIFNHRAESPTYIIALSGAALWFFSQQKNRLNLILIVLAFLFASLSPTDVFPYYLRENFIKPYVLKAVPLIFIWLKILFELIFEKYQPYKPADA